MLNLMKLERRIVLDGAAVAVAGAVDHASDHDDISAGESYAPDHATDSTSVAEAAALLGETDAAPQEEGIDVILVSDALQDHETLVEAADPDAHVIVYDAERDSAEDVIGKVAQLSEETGMPVDSLSLLSHGGDGSFRIGNETVFTGNLDDNAESWAELGNAFSEDGRIYLFGCKIAGESDSLVDSLAEATGADVYASDDITGAAGDWVLETGSEDAADNVVPPFDMEKLADYDGNLFTDNFPIRITTMEDEPGLFGIYAWGSDVGPANMPTINFIDMNVNVSTQGNQLLQDSITLQSPGTWITDNPIIIEGQVVSQYWRWTVEYQPEEDQHGGAVELNFTVNQVPQTAYVTILPVNDPPEALPLTLTTPEDTPISGDVEATDKDNTPDELTFQPASQPANGTVTNWDPATGTFTYTPNPDFFGTDTFLYTVTDPEGASSTATVTIIVTPVPDAPVINPGDGLCYYENAGPMRIDTDISVTDVDSATLTGAVIQITDNYDRGGDFLIFEDTGNIAGTWNEQTGTLVLNGSASVTAYQSAIRSVQFEHVGEDPMENNRIITYEVTDETGLRGVAEQEVFVDAINDPPELGPEGTLTIEYDTQELESRQVVVGDGLTISDIDDSDLPSTAIDDSSMSRAVVQFVQDNNHVYIPGEDVIAFGESSGFQVSWDEVGGVLTMTGTGTISQYETALRSVTYENTNADPTEGTRRITFAVTDGNSRGNGSGVCAGAPNGGPMDSSADTEVDVVRDIVVIVDHPPEVTPSADRLCFPENADPMALDANVQVADADGSLITGATVQITQGYRPGEDVLAFAGTGNISGNWNEANGTLTLTGNASASEYQQALRSITYWNSMGDRPTEGDRVVTFAVTDDTNLVGTGDRTVFVDAVNDAPEFNELTVNWEYAPGDGLATIASNLTLTDVDDTDMSGAVIQISPETYETGEDVLHFTDTGNIAGVWDPNTGTMTLTGTASVEEYQAAIQSVTYENLLDEPTESVRILALTVTDANSGGDGDIICTNVSASEGPGGPLAVTATSEGDVGERFVQKDPGELTTPGGPPGPDSASPPEAESPGGVLDAGDAGIGRPGEDGGPPASGFRGEELTWDQKSGDDTVDFCSIDHSLRSHLGCRFANTLNPESKLGAVKWSDLGWERPLLDEEYDLFTKLFVREHGDKGFNIELGALAQLGGLSGAPKVFAPSDAEDFNDMDAGELKNTFFDGRDHLDKTWR